MSSVVKTLLLLTGRPKRKNSMYKTTKPPSRSAVSQAPPHELVKQDDAYCDKKATTLRAMPTTIPLPGWYATLRPPLLVVVVVAVPETEGAVETSWALVMVLPSSPVAVEGGWEVSVGEMAVNVTAKLELLRLEVAAWFAAGEVEVVWLLVVLLLRVEITDVIEDDALLPLGVVVKVTVKSGVIIREAGIEVYWGRVWVMDLVSLAISWVRGVPCPETVEDRLADEVLRKGAALI